MSELLLCPFCGGEADTWDGAGPWHVVCTKCGTVGSPCLTESEAIASWNTRAERTCILVEDEDIECLLHCSNCGSGAPKQSWSYWTYCPNCGARVIKSDQDLWQEVGE